ncbi:MAG: MFS transporter [Dehalococcoidia bacterium]|nr:MFS transporter [Dehalococcoidia bacterium]
MLGVLTLKRPHIFPGWYIVAGCWLIHFYLVAVFFIGFTNVFNPIRKEMGWTAAATALAFSIQRFEGGIASPIVGFVLDRYGPRKLMLAGMLAVGLSFVLMSRMQHLWQFYGIFLLLSLALSMGFSAPFNVAVVRWFAKKRGRALGIIYTGGSFSAFLIPLYVLLIQSVGWRTALLYAGLGVWLFLVPATALVRSRPEPYGYLPDGEPLPPGQTAGERQATLDASRRASGSGLTARQAVRTPAFWLISAAFALSGMNIGAVIVFIVPHLTSDSVTPGGFSPQAAAFIASLLIGLSGPWRVIAGTLADRIPDKKWIMAGVFALEALAMVVLGLTHSYWMAILFALIMGLPHGASIPVRPAFYGDYFGTRAFATIQGLSGALSVAVGVAGPVMAGLIFDRTGSYAPAFFIMAAATVFALPLLIAARKPEWAAAARG